MSSAEDSALTCMLLLQLCYNIIVIHDYHKIILHTVESRSVNVPLIVAATVPSVVVVILVSVIIVTFTMITVYKQLQKKHNEGNNLYDTINLSDVQPVPPGLPPQILSLRQTRTLLMKHSNSRLMRRIGT